MLQASALSFKGPHKLWWLIGLIVFGVFVVLQMPASWILSKYAPQSPYVQQVSGNLWQGSAIWQVPNTNESLTGSARWHWQPWYLFLGQFAADVDISADQTRLNGQVRVSRNAWQVKDMKGKIAPQTLSSLVNWQLPNTPIQVNAVGLKRQSATQSGTTKAGFSQAEGQLTWVGGEVGYPNEDKILYIAMPAMRAQLSHEQKGDSNRLHVNLIDKQDKRLGDLYLDGDNMLDFSLTQRLLENMPEYQGQAPQDTPVVSVRQPLLTGLGAR